MFEEILERTTPQFTKAVLEEIRYHNAKINKLFEDSSKNVCRSIEDYADVYNEVLWTSFLIDKLLEYYTSSKTDVGLALNGESIEVMENHRIHLLSINGADDSEEFKKMHIIGAIDCLLSDAQKKIADRSPAKWTD